MDRPFPAAADEPPIAPQWATADLRYDRWHGLGTWRAGSGEAVHPAAWTMHHEGVTFELRATDTGQVGFFGDQVDHWAWLRALLAAAERRPAASPAAEAARLDPDVAAGATSVLNLFAYTGGATLVAARSGAAVTHVDASRPAVAWARRNAALSGLDAAPIRWIVDDAQAFAEREGRRGRRYDGVVLDPPSYGHGRGGRRWELRAQLPALLAACADLLSEEPQFVLLTAHTTGLAADELGAALTDALAPVLGRAEAARVTAGPVVRHAASGRTAVAGSMARWSR